MKKIITLGILSLVSIVVASQNWTSITQPTSSPATITLVSSDIKTTIIQLKIPGYNLKELQTPRGIAYSVSIENATSLLQTGCPDLPKVVESIIIPDNGLMKVEVVSSTYTDFAAINIAPSKGNFTRNIDPSTVPFTYNNLYNENEFFPGTIVELGEPYILRDFRGQTVKINPFQYNPITHVLRVYHDVKVKISKQSDGGVNQLNRNKELTKVNEEFQQIYANHFLNFKNNPKYTTLGNEHGRMLIICYGAYVNEMQSFVNWKNMIGIQTEIVDVSTIGNNATAIQNYVANYYNTYGLSFLLLVGDAAQVAPKTSGFAGASDNAYGYLVGGDHYQEIFVGRFSAESIGDVQTQVERTINYEKTPSTTPGIYNKCIGIGSDQGPGDDNELDFEHQRNLQTLLMNFTYTSRSEFFDGSQGGLDASGNPTPTMIENDINSGAGIINYTGHGSQTSWGTSGFSNSNIASLTNNNKLPFIWSVACVNGDFANGTCFAEAWMRATYNGHPSGAIATLMSTINQSWNPPMEGQDEMIAILTESFINNIKRSFGGLSVNGMFKMNDTYGDFDMTDTWTLFGDPSIMVRTANPLSMTVTHNAYASVGDVSLNVNSNVEGAYVCLTVNHQIIGTGTISGGTTTITFSPLTTTDSITVAATAFNYIPYLGKVDVMPVGIENTVQTPTFSVFPNPVNNNLVQFDFLVPSSKISLKLFNVIGKEVAVILDNQGNTAGNHKISFNTSSLNQGIYFAVMKTDEQTITRKIMINK